MEIRRELVMTIGALVVLNLLLAFGAIGLFVRMGPVIEHILQENVCSIDAAEEMLAALADAGSAPLSADARRRVWRELAKAKKNVTEQQERPVLAALERALPAAMRGDDAARAAAVAAIREVIRINRRAMGAVDQEARRLGSAGAWAAVLVGFLSFVLSVVLVRRVQRRFVRPLIDLHDVLERSRQGDSFRRCSASVGPRELIHVMRSVNELLDERLARSSYEAR